MTASAEYSTPTSGLIARMPEDARFRLLHGQYCHGIWRYLRRLGLTSAEADDATQQVFFVLSKRLPAVLPGSERAFAYQVASRVASDVRRGAARRYEVSSEGDPGSAATRPDDLLEERRRLMLLDEILATLPPEPRQVFVLYEIEELPMKEIALILGIPPGTVASRLRRARDEFKHRAARYRNGGGS